MSWTDYVAERQRSDQARAQESAQWTERLRAQGKLTPDQAVWIDANDDPHVTQKHAIPEWAWPLLFVGSMAAAPVIASAFGGAPAATAASQAPATASATAPLTATPTIASSGFAPAAGSGLATAPAVASPGVVSGASGVAAAAPAAVKAGMGWRDIIELATGVGANIYERTKASSAAKKAAEQQIAAGERAIGMLGGINAQQRTDLSPYMNVGGNAANRLNTLMGFQAAQPTASPMARLAPQQAPAQPQMVTLRAPNGMTKQVPADQVAHYQQLGAQVVQ